MRQFARRAAVMVFATVAVGCQTVTPYEPEPDGPLKLEMMTVEAQVCLPSPLVSEGGPNGFWANRYGPHGEGKSERGMMLFKGTPTSVGQQVFDHSSAMRQSDILGYAITPVGPGPTYVFFLTHPPLTPMWTSWEAPQAETADMFHTSLWGPARVVPSGQARTNTPRMRFRLVAFREVFTFPRNTSAEIPPPC